MKNSINSGSTCLRVVDTRRDLWSLLASSDKPIPPKVLAMPPDHFGQSSATRAGVVP
jgi:hypothetical protein